jgi:glutaredoxin
MKKNILKNPLLYIVLVFVLIGTFYGYKTIIGRVIDTENNMDSFAQCLSKKGAVMYGTETCPYCVKQKNLFGDSFIYVNYIDCQKNPQECVGLSGVPTWKINGKLYPGLKSLEQLSELSGCVL